MNEINKYNSLVEKWNNMYGEKCEGIKVNEEDLRRENKIDILKKRLLSKRFTEKQKIKHTITVIGDFAILPKKPSDSSEYERGELAYIIVKSGKYIISKY